MFFTFVSWTNFSKAVKQKNKIVKRIKVVRFINLSPVEFVEIIAQIGEK
jgi:ribosomal protein L36